MSKKAAKTALFIVISFAIGYSIFLYVLCPTYSRYYENLFVKIGIYAVTFAVALLSFELPINLLIRRENKTTIKSSIRAALCVEAFLCIIYTVLILPTDTDFNVLTVMLYMFITAICAIISTCYHKKAP